MADKFVLTPWESKGDIDYAHLTTQFGTQTLTDALKDRLYKMAGQSHYMVRRGIFFSHRDLDVILDSQQSGTGFFLYTGRGPSGSTHIGHLVPWVFSKWLQDRFGATMYFQLTNDEKFYRRGGPSLERATELAYENAKDFAALGFDPDLTHILIDTHDINTLYPLAATVAKRINYSTVKAAFGFGDDTNIGMIFYTALQSAPCFLEDRPVLIPLGVDQDPHFRLTRDVAPILNRPKPALLHNIMMPGLRGPGGKMSASDVNSAIYTSDTDAQIKTKINRYAFSGGQRDIDEHRRLGGDTSVDVSYQYLRTFFEPDDAQLEKIRVAYSGGAMLSGEIKQILIEKITKFMETHRNKRDSVHLEEFMFDPERHKAEMRR